MAQEPAGQTVVDLRIEPAGGPAAAPLIAALDADIMSRYPGLPVNGIDAAGFEAGGGVFVVGYLGGEPAVCGALRPGAEVWEPDAMEVKRMFVASEFRGRGLARRMLRFLEDEAARRGFRRAILETGKAQFEAIGLYGSSGWRRTGLYGPFAGNPESVCFEKRIGGD